MQPARLQGRVVTLWVPARTTPSCGVCLSAFGADLSGPGLNGAQSKPERLPCRQSKGDGPLDGLSSFERPAIMKNTVTLVGFVGNNPEVRTTQSGASITTVSLATTNSFKDSEGKAFQERRYYVLQDDR
jgi:Single-strand binding protein family